MSSTKKKGFYTIKITSILLALSVCTEIFSIRSDTLFLGFFFSGWVAVIRHLIYIIIYALISMSLWYGKTWTPKLVYGSAAFCILDTVGYLVARDKVVSRIFDELNRYGDFSQLIDRSQIIMIITLFSSLLIAGWGGFALYIYFRRAYFLTETEDNPKNDELNTYDGSGKKAS